MIAVPMPVRFLLLAAVLTVAAPGPAPGQPCASDCNGSGDVTVDELVRAVNIALGSGAIGSCTAADRNGNGSVTVDELVGAVGAALSGCTPTSPAPTRTATATPPAGGTPTSTRTVAVTPGLAPNQLDDRFGVDGLAAPRIGLGASYIAGLANAPGGGLYFAGDGTAGTQLNGHVVRLTAAGALDTTFNGTGVKPVDVWTCTGGGFSPLNESMYEVAVDADDRVVMAGSTTVDGGTERFAVARFTSAGALDTSFGSNGCVTIDANPEFESEYVSSMLIQPDGRILLAGWTEEEDTSASAVAVVRLTEAGALDTEFADGGRFIIGDYPSPTTLGLRPDRVGVALQSTGRIVISHSVALAGPTVAFGVTRLDAGGRLDTSFGDAGSFVRQAISGRFNFAVDLAVVSGDRIVVGGSVRNANNQCDFAVMRISADGVLDEAFGDAGATLMSLGATDASDYLGDLVVDSAGRIIAAGVRNAVGAMSGPSLAVARFDADGRVDGNGFCATGTLGPRVTSNVRALVDDQDRILVSYYDPALGNPNPNVVGVGILRYRGGAGTGLCGAG